MMKISADAITWNLGDNSFRRKALIHDYRVLLEELYSLNNEHPNIWNPTVQSVYYANVRANDDIHILSTVTEDDKMAKMGRTFSSGLFKLGFCDKKRKLSNIGLQFLGKKKLNLDDFENRLNLKSDNIIFLRQLLKLYIWDEGAKKAFNPFIFLIIMLNKYEYLTKQEFEAIIQISSGKINFQEIIEKFEDVRLNKINLDEFFNNNVEGNDFSNEVNKFINDDNLDEKLFERVFFNRKTALSKKEYLNFYNILIDYKKDKHNEEKLSLLIKSIKSEVIKKAFGTSSIFDTRRLKKIDCNTFNNRYKNVKLLSYDGKDFRNEFVKNFLDSKREDIVKEYRDMTYRVFNTTGIIETRNNIIKINNLYAKEYFKLVNDFLNITLNSKEQCKIEEVLSSIEILKINKVLETDKRIREKYGLSNEIDIISYINKKENDDFKNFILREFKKEKIINILNLIKVRNDIEVCKLVTDQTTVPTIFEYILGIAWLYISEFKIDLLSSLNLTLDSSYYPLSHAAGGDGDIIINYEEPKKHKLMLEVTLMDRNTQKRGELEPVIRHSVNLGIESDENVYSIFVANELDNNVINIFRACNLLNLESSKNKGKYINSTKIVALKIDEVIKLLEKDISYNHIFENIENEFINDNIQRINSQWREKFVKRIFEV
ncbi:AlwI family type II restriction endonuclease [Clostridium baratii]|uniref:AlwI family type II restriction endonuclease n=1 Tax=Clostridium baratii TaxID=1561 RepID=UPI001C023BD4|nr:AlwI family type II restriction endonuclease [Clostridium baratii]MBT9832399.1 AlwI family type II restriction endonuclease [Clostridium baratii]